MVSTPNYSWVIPTPGGDGDQWGDIINAALIAADASLKDVADGAYTKAAADARYSQLAHTHTFASLTSKPTTVAGYGITDYNTRNIATNGYQKLPGGVIIQWGSLATGTGNTTVNFPMAFPNAIFSVVTTAVFDNGVNQFVSVAAISAAKTGFVAVPRYVLNGGAVAAAGTAMNWFAVGN